MGLRISAFLFIVAAAGLVAASLFPETSQRKISMIFLSDEQKALFSECEGARQALHEQGLPARFAAVDFSIRDKRFENDPILADLQKCFPKSNEKNAAYRLEIELFSSDYGQESSSDIQVQISGFEMKSGNKVAEAGFRMDHAPYKPAENVAKASGAPAAPGNPAGAQAPAAAPKAAVSYPTERTALQK